MLTFASYLCFLTCSLGLIFSLYILLRFREYNATYVLLALIFSLCWIEFYMFALSSRNILNMTFLFRTAFPFRTLAPVFLWLYVWRMLNPNKPYHYLHLLHFVIPLVIIIGLVPDFMQPISYKYAMLKTFYTQNNYLMIRKTGMFPKGFIQPFLLIYGLAYIFYALFYIIRVKKQKSILFIKTNNTLLQWIMLVSIVNLIFVLLQSVQYLSLLVKGDFSFFSQIGQSLSLISLKVYLLVHPNAIENMSGCIEVVEEMSPSPNVISTILPIPNPKHAHSEVFKLVFSFIESDQGFRNPDLNLEQMSEQLALSKSKLSAYLQEFYHMSFPEIINRYRIHHFIELFKKDSLRQMKVETLILQSGYRNKTTFYLAFKKVLKTNPSAFIKSME